MDEADYASNNEEFFRKVAFQNHVSRSRNSRSGAQQYPGVGPLGSPGVGASGPRVCLDCGDEIGAARMTANPAAVRCIGCQTKKERRR